MIVLWTHSCCIYILGVRAKIDVSPAVSYIVSLYIHNPTLLISLEQRTIGERFTFCRELFIFAINSQFTLRIVGF